MLMWPDPEKTGLAGQNGTQRLAGRDENIWKVRGPQRSISFDKTVRKQVLQYIF